MGRFTGIKRVLVGLNERRAFPARMPSPHYFEKQFFWLFDKTPQKPIVGINAFQFSIVGRAYDY
jgi:hypothetical protein